jgi:hypothetical protein
MLISHSKKFIFLHNYKVAGTSVRNTLGKYATISFRGSSVIDKFRILTGKYPKIYSNKFNGHIRAAALKNELPPQIFDTYFKFGFVRNPWDWQVSLYTFTLNLKTHYQHELIKSMKDFDAYIDWRVHKELRLQKDFFYDNEGKCLVDYIGKFENLDRDFAQICNRIQIHDTLPVMNSSRRGSDFLSYYSQRSIDMVNEAFKTDIELFGYKKPAKGMSMS